MTDRKHASIIARWTILSNSCSALIPHYIFYCGYYYSYRVIEKSALYFYTHAIIRVPKNREILKQFFAVLLWYYVVSRILRPTIKNILFFPIVFGNIIIPTICNFERLIYVIDWRYLWRINNNASIENILSNADKKSDVELTITDTDNLYPKKSITHLQ